jgi:hypothetical protein
MREKERAYIRGEGEGMDRRDIDKGGRIGEKEGA